jgi:hypothetical protein
MASGTVARFRALTDALVAGAALGMKRVCLEYDLVVCDFCIFRVVAVEATVGRGPVRGFRLRMAFTAGSGVVFAGRMVVTITAGGAVFLDMTIVVEQHLFGVVSREDQPEWFFRRLGGKGGITEDTHNEENNRDKIDVFQVFLCCHRRFIPLM